SPTPHTQYHRGTTEEVLPTALFLGSSSVAMVVAEGNSAHTYIRPLRLMLSSCVTHTHTNTDTQTGRRIHADAAKSKCIEKLQCVAIEQQRLAFTNVYA
ncbi:hypothetical protein WUBG_06850, partial [Wuchereria bancrofti]